VAAKVLGWLADGQFHADGALPAGQEAAVVLDATNFYGEQGGQVGDTGRLVWSSGRFEVTDAQSVGATVLHVGSVTEGSLAVGETVTCRVEGRSRVATMRNHTATHLLNWALREVLGDHVNQAGSVVAPNRLRFDFSHNQAVTAEQQAQVERLVNEWIMADEPVGDQTLPLGEALKIDGIRAMFGEKYPDPVRVVMVGGGEGLTGTQHPLELCGGTHVTRTGQIGLFKIISEESVCAAART
jgi:alanyl-tRNA synthetase